MFVQCILVTVHVDQESRRGPKKAEWESNNKENSGHNVLTCKCKQSCNSEVNPTCCFTFSTNDNVNDCSGRITLCHSTGSAENCSSSSHRLIDRNKEFSFDSFTGASSVHELLVNSFLWLMVILFYSYAHAPRQTHVLSMHEYWHTLVQ